VTAAGRKPGYVVLRRVGEDRWKVVGEVERRPGQTAKAARAQAIRDAMGRDPKAGEAFRAVLLSEWRIAAE
jgi:hypothetical protein